MKLFLFTILLLWYTGESIPVSAQSAAIPVVRRQALSSSDFIFFYGNTDNIAKNIQLNKPVTVAFLGGSITNMKGWRDMVCQFLSEKYPSVQFNFINAGIPSLGSVPHAFRFRSDVLAKGKIDWLFVESAVNDKANNTGELQQRRALEGIIRQAYSANPLMNIVLMAFADEFKLADYKEGKIPVEVGVHEDIAKYYHLPFINLAKEVYERIQAGEFSWENDFKNLHPSPFGQQIYFNTISTYISKAVNKPISQGITKTKMPLPMQSLQYGRGDYLSFDAALHRQGFSIDPEWKPADSAKTREGFVHVPMLTGETIGASFDLSFTGTAVGLAVVAGPDAGTIGYSIDGEPGQTLDLYNRYSASLHLPQYVLLADELSDSKHSIHIKILKEKNTRSKGHAVRIVHLLVNK